MISDRTKDRVLAVAILMTPLVLVQGVRLVAGPSVATANAASQPPIPVHPSFEAPKPVTPQQSDAAAFIAAFRTSQNLPNPFDVTPRAAEGPSPAPAPATTRPADEPAPVPEVVVTAILGSPANPLVSIDHRILKPGSPLEDGWVIDSIDTRSRTVTVRHTDGRTAVLAPKPRS